MKNAIIGQSGGPTSVINASLAGVIDGVRQGSGIDKLWGMRFGIEGFMKGDMIDLSSQNPGIVEGLKTTPSSALGSCRYKLKDQDLPAVLKMLAQHEIHYLFLIGGNDTMDTICRVEAYAQKQGYDLRGIGIPKTVDNDLFGTDHTPGFGSAARYMALSVAQAGTLARDMRKVDQFSVFQCIGREAGWLVGATAAGKRTADDAPHIMCFPERPFEKAKFLKNVKNCYDKHGFAYVICGEGICYADGTCVSSSQTQDKFGNVEFGAMGGTSVAIVLHRMIADEFGFRGEFQITESLPMCAADRAVQSDTDEAFLCGQKAVELALSDTTGVMVTLQREPGAEYKCTTGTIPLNEVAIKARPLPDEYINAEGNFITDEFLEYLKPLVGPMPEYVKLENNK